LKNDWQMLQRSRSMLKSKLFEAG